MSKKSNTTFTCTECGGDSPKWLGQCPHCKAWNTLEERAAVSTSSTGNRFASLAGTSPCVPLGKVQAQDYSRIPTGITELDRVLGGGVVQGSVTLMGGEPGIGKSTLLLQAMHALQESGRKVLYVTGEESTHQVSLRAKRLGMKNSEMLIASEIQLEKIVHYIDQHQPEIMVVDSIQTVWTDQLTAAPGSVSQVRECAAHLTRIAKMRDLATFLIGHVTKEGSVAGPRVLEHIVDTVVTLEGDNQTTYRIARAQKNRFGPSNEVGVFAMVEAGMKCVPNPSAIFLNQQSAPAPGSVVMATMEGTRPILVEIQALIDSGGASPRRLTLGLERDRLAMLLAVLNRHGGLSTSNDDVFLNVVGGMKVAETASDLAVVVAILSSIRSSSLRRDLIVFGEIGLAGEVRPCAKGQERLNEAAKLGFKHAIVPRANAPKKAIAGLTVHPVDRISDALTAVRNLP